MKCPHCGYKDRIITKKVKGRRRKFVEGKYGIFYHLPHHTHHTVNGMITGYSDLVRFPPFKAKESVVLYACPDIEHCGKTFVK